MQNPRRIDRYEVRGTLGQGAMGSVYLAWDPKLHREVAVKLVTRRISADTKVRGRFHREARAIAALRHPNIVEIYDYSGSDSKDLYLVMERLEGEDLYDMVARCGPMPEPAAAAVGHELCLALATAHEAGVIHRDIKPENVFVLRSGRVVLTDFGVVKAVRENSAVDGYNLKTDVIGTPGFMAPEQMMSRDLGPATDVFALGSLLYNILTGQLPFDGDAPVDIYRAMLSGTYEDPRRFNQQISQEFTILLEKSLQYKARRRYDNVEEMRQRLKRILEANGVTSLRDDLRDYVQDHGAYATAALRRSVEYLLERTKIAVKDKDHQLVAQLRERLLVLDPNNLDFGEISGVLDAGETHVGESRPVSKPRVKGPSGRAVVRGTRAPSGKPAYLLASAVAVLGVGLAVYLGFNPRELMVKRDDPQSETAAPVNESSTPGHAPPDSGVNPPPSEDPGQLAMIEIRVRGGPGILFVDGKRMGRTNNRTVAVKPGEHLIEVRGRGRRLRKSIVASPEAAVGLNVDLRRGEIAQVR